MASDAERLIRPFLNGGPVPQPSETMMVNMPDGHGGVNTVPIEQANIVLLDAIANRLDAVVTELKGLRADLAKEEL